MGNELVRYEYSHVRGKPIGRNRYVPVFCYYEQDTNDARRYYYREINLPFYIDVLREGKQYWKRVFFCLCSNGFL